VQFEQHIPASINIAMNNKFMQNQCAVVVSTDSDRDSQNYWYFQSRGARSIIRCTIFTNNGDLFGFVGIDFNNNIQSSDVEQKLGRVQRSAADISRIFITKTR